MANFGCCVCFNPSSLNDSPALELEEDAAEDPCIIIIIRVMFLLPKCRLLPNARRAARACCCRPARAARCSGGGRIVLAGGGAGSGSPNAVAPVDGGAEKGVRKRVGIGPARPRALRHNKRVRRAAAGARPGSSSRSSRCRGGMSLTPCWMGGGNRTSVVESVDQSGPKEGAGGSCAHTAGWPLGSSNRIGEASHGFGPSVDLTWTSTCQRLQHQPAWPCPNCGPPKASPGAHKAVRQADAPIPD